MILNGIANQIDKIASPSGSPIPIVQVDCDKSNSKSMKKLNKTAQSPSSSIDTSKSDLDPFLMPSVFNPPDLFMNSANLVHGQNIQQWKIFLYIF